MSYETLLLEQREGIAIVTLNRPDRLNAVNIAMTAELKACLAALQADDAVKVAVITGAGDRAFSAGADIFELRSLSPEAHRARQESFNDLAWQVASFPKPLIGAINGLAHGGSALITTILDIRLGCPRTEFRFAAIAVGRANSTWTLPLVVGLPRAMELLLTGRAVGAEEALQIGLLNQLVPADDLMEATLEMAKLIAGHKPDLVREVKSLLRRNIGEGWEQRFRNEMEVFGSAEGFAPPEEGFRRFLERKGEGD